MATSIVSARSPQPWRIEVVIPSAGSYVASSFVVERHDGVTTPITVTLAFVIGGSENRLMLALSEPLREGASYDVRLVAEPDGVAVAFRGAVTSQTSPVEDDINLRRWGVDLAWCSSGGLNSRGDVPRRTGVECVRHDLAALCLLSPSEVFHRPRAGANLRRFTNAPSLLQGAVAASIRSAWTKDPRVRTGSVSLDAQMDAASGELSIQGQVVLDASGEVLNIDSSVVER